MTVPARERHATRRTRMAVATGVSMAGLTAAFATILAIDVRLYAALPDPSLVPIQVLLLAATAVAATRWRWAPTIAAVVAVAVGIGSAVQPITTARLTDAETVGLQVATWLLLAFAAGAGLSGLAATAGTLRAGRR